MVLYCPGLNQTTVCLPDGSFFCDFRCFFVFFPRVGAKSAFWEPDSMHMCPLNKFYLFPSREIRVRWR